MIFKPQRIVFPPSYSHSLSSFDYYLNYLRILAVHGLPVGVPGGLSLCAQQAAVRVRLLQLPVPALRKGAGGGTAAQEDPGGGAGHPRERQSGVLGRSQPFCHFSSSNLKSISTYFPSFFFFVCAYRVFNILWAQGERAKAARCCPVATPCPCPIHVLVYLFMYLLLSSSWQTGHTKALKG